MTSAEIRQSFLKFFHQNRHTIVPSASLMPDSPGLLFTNAGMNQFVPIFLGERKADISGWAGATPAGDTRAADTQKCIRAGGKHNDLEDVGWDTYHHTFFEMFGNWSFGDYFKKESIEWGWELLTKVWGMPPKRLFASVFCPYMGTTNWETKWEQELRYILSLAESNQTAPAQDASSVFENCDFEAALVWARLFRQAGLDPSLHTLPGNKKDNFWMMGDTGPCGPCSEIHFNLLPSDDEAAGRALVNAGSPRCIEIWNHVFIQFNANADGTFAPLAAKHVDTGMGFERVAGIHATTKGFKDFSAEPSNYNADVFTQLFDCVEKLSGKRYAGTVPKSREGVTQQEADDVAFRVLADHARCVSCAIADGILPGNDGRNYVIRRILRRGILYGKKLGLQTGFFEALVAPVVETLGGVFPELVQQQTLITRVIRGEEESFGRTLDRGLSIFNEEVAKLSVSDGPGIEGPGSARVPRAASGVSPDATTAIRYSKRRLPHFERPWGKYHVTFATVDRAQLQPSARQIVLDSLIHGHREGRYHLFATCVMPDHVHALLEPQPKPAPAGAETEFYALGEILHSIKSYTAHAINKAEGTAGSVWEKESFDRLIRSEGDLQEKFSYIIRNSKEAKLADAHGDYEFLWTGDTAPETVRRDAGPNLRDAGAPRTVSDGAPEVGSPRTIPGEVAFELYDTYGFPLDMTQLLAAERGLAVDTAAFEAEMEKQRARGRAAHTKEVIVAATEADEAVHHAPTEFLGYTQLEADAKLLEAIASENGTWLVFDRTPFYAEMGGQAGDAGTVTFGDVTLPIVDCVKDKSGRFLHQLAPDLKLQLPTSNSAATLRVDATRRRAINRHHSAAHLVHWALRKVLGTHVRQAGTSKTPDRLRFDFSHFEQVKPGQLVEIERLVNERVIDNAAVRTFETEYDKRPEGTLAFFGDKYGKIVRVVDIGGYSLELCGGTHVTTTGEIGVVKIVAEMAIAAGTRRVEAVAGSAALDLIAARESALGAVSSRLSAGAADVVQKVDLLIAHKAEIEKKLKSLEQKAAAGVADELAAAAVERDGLKFVSAVVASESAETLRALGSQVLAKIGEGVVQLGSVIGEKATVVALASPAAIKAGHQAGRIVSALCASLGGKGGGRAEYAMGGGRDAAKLAGVMKPGG